MAPAGPLSSRTDTDVVILGAGAAGAAAAITATRAGLDVTVLEVSTPQQHTPNVRMSGGWIMTVDDVDEGLRYLRACAGGLVDEELLAAWAREARELPLWLEGLGVELQESAGFRKPEHPDLDGASTMGNRRAWTGLAAPIADQPGWFEPDTDCLGGEALYRGLMTELLNSGARILWGAEVTRLVVDAGGVRGVSARVDGRTLEIHASRGVVVATGGFGASRDLILNFIDAPTTEFYGNPMNRGDGLRLGMSVGAELVRMNRFIGRGVAAFDHSETGMRLGFILDMEGGGYAIVDSTGRRYMNEVRQAELAHDVLYAMQEFDSARGSYTRSPSYYFFDQQRLDAGPLTYPDRGVTAVGLYDWSPDNHKELAAGWIGVGDTPLDAALAVGAQPSDQFDRAIDNYNAACATGVDTFGRPRDSLRKLVAPFYCIPLYVGGPHTSGGLRRDSVARVIAALDGQPIDGLYSAGELGQAIGLLYPVQGASLSDALCSGIVAGRAVAERAA